MAARFGPHPGTRWKAIRIFKGRVMRNLRDAGFAPPAAQPSGTERRTFPFAELIATIVLTVCTVIVAIVVTAGIARADVGSDVIGNEDSLFAVALLLGLVFIGIGGFSLLPRGRRHRH
jgi:hypothetical protein